MLPLLRLSPEDLDRCRTRWREFAAFAYVFLELFSEQQRAFAFYGTLDVGEDGTIALVELLVARSCRHTPDEQGQHLDALREAVAGAGWRVTGSDGGRSEYERDIFRLALVSEVGPEHTAVTRVLLSYGETDSHAERHLQEHFPACPPPQPSERPESHFYPVGSECAPDKAERLDVEELASRVRGRPVVALTGAGISLDSGIPAFRGPGGLEEHFPLLGSFPGAVAEWMVERPRELATVLGRFQASFITARPSAAHRALAELEKQGTVVRVVTGNKDRLHELAGSRRVLLKDQRHFVGSDEGWRWLREGEVLLVVGIHEDEHGLITYARDRGLQVAAVSPEPPSFLYAGDWFIAGSAQEVLPHLAAALSRRR